MYGDGQGMNTLKKVVQSARANGKKIGPQHHMHDKHYKKWLEQQKEKAK